MGEKERLVMREMEKVMEGGMSSIEEACWTSWPIKMVNVGVMGDVVVHGGEVSRLLVSFFFFFLI